MDSSVLSQTVNETGSIIQIHFKSAKSSKTGEDYNYLEIKIGELEYRQFPSPVETRYVKDLLGL